MLHLWAENGYLTGRVLRFHPVTETIRSYLSPEVEVVRIGLAESWRRGLRAVLRKQAGAAL